MSIKIKKQDLLIYQDTISSQAKHSQAICLVLHQCLRNQDRIFILQLTGFHLHIMRAGLHQSNRIPAM